ncbi:MAG: ABC transporter permease, partial [Planctomycetota bacterium]
AADLALPGKVRSAAEARLSDWGEFSVPALVGAFELAADSREKRLLLLRLQRNAKRTLLARVGRPFTEEERRLGREIDEESREIDARLAIDRAEPYPDSVIEERVQLWREWFERRGSRWERSFWEKLRIRAFETRFAQYWSNLLRLDLGDSHVHKEPVLSLIVSRIPVSLTLSVTSLLLAYVISVPLGVWAATRHRTRREQALSTLLFMLYSLPSFFVAMLLFRYLGIGRPFKIIPVAGYESGDTFSMTTWQHIRDVLWHCGAPLFCMTYAGLAALSRYAKSGVLNVIRADYIRTARAKGLSERVVVYKHAVRNGIIPILTLLGNILPAIVGGSVVVETVFSIPGIGHLIWTSINSRDYNVVIGESLIVAVLTMFGILLSDILYAVVDPRIGYR